MSKSIYLLRRVLIVIIDFLRYRLGVRAEVRRIPGEPITREIENENRLARESARIGKPA